MIGTTPVLKCASIMAAALLCALLAPTLIVAAEPTVSEVQAVFSQDRQAVDGAGLALEARPAKGFGAVAEGAAVDADEFYRASGRKIALYRSAEKVVVRGDSADAALNRVNTVSDATFEPEASLPSAAVHILAAASRLDQASLDTLLANPEIEPLYINEETATEVVVTDRFVVQLAPGARRAALAALNNTHGVAVVAPLHGTDRQFVCRKAGAKATEILALCETYHQDVSVAWASPDFVFQLELYYTPTDPLFFNQWHLNNSGQTGATADADVDAAEAWDRVDTPQGGSPDVVIAIIDSGVDIDHEDLDDNIYENPIEASGTPGFDDDGNGYTDDINGWDFYGGDNNPRPTTEAHGTACAGVAAAEEGNGLGGVGAAFNCSILPVKISADSGAFASSTNIANGIRYAADMAHVLSNSWGGGGDDSTVHSAIQYAVNTRDKVVLFASGNDADGTNSSPAWRQYTLSGFPSGTFTFSWQYTKDVSVSAGDDTVWLDDITFPGGATQGFEGSFPPPGWTTGGNASWSRYSESRHVRGTGCHSAKAGTISHNQSTYLQTTRSVGAGDLVYYAWVSSEAGYDEFAVYVNGNPYLAFSGVPVVNYDVAYPARYAECIAVGASTDFDIRSAYSQYDETLSNVLDIVAPSNGGYGGITTTDISGSNGYASGNYTSGFGGTSSATPLAAGVAALVLSKNATLTSAEVQTILETSADEIGCQSYTGHYNKSYGHGRINANAALAATPSAAVCPTITDDPDPDTVCEGDPATFCVVATGTEPLDYQWETDAGGSWQDIPGAQSDCLTLLSVTPADQGQYRCRVSNTCGSVTSNAAGLTVQPLPVPPATASSDRDGFCADDPGSIQLSASGGSGDTLRWFDDTCGGNGIGTGSPLVIPSPTVTTTYYARWENACGDSACAGVTVTVDDLDTDGDGTPDCADGCPSDPNKTDPGVCGCGVPDTDTDGDGTSDCVDGCPADPNKTDPGVCGCGVPDTDSDGDGVPDCIDNCPAHANPDQADCDEDGQGDVCTIAECPGDPACEDANGNGVPDECDPAITGWVSRKVHIGHANPLELELEALGTGTAAVSETRLGGVDWIEVTFDQDVAACYLPGQVLIEDLTNGGSLLPTGESLIIGGTVLRIDIAGGLPDRTCYRIDLSASVFCVAGDLDCQVRSLIGDTSGVPGHGDGITNLIDAAETKQRNGFPVLPDNVRFDINLDGDINLIDYAEVKQRNSNTGVCP